MTSDWEKEFDERFIATEVNKIGLCKDSAKKLNINLKHRL